MKRLWLYRVLENDSAGDPIDFGVLRASTEEEAKAMLDQHMFDHLDLEEQYAFRLYDLVDAPAGILESGGYKEFTVGKGCAS
ncbi:MAG: hypothetical protein ACJ8FY_15225 [Gemmataceae bacterium]